MTASVWHSWVFPVRNSPNISVMEPVSIPPAGQTTKDFILPSICTNCYILSVGLTTDSQGGFVDCMLVVQTLQEFVQLLGARRDLDDLRSPLVELSRCGEAHRHKFGCFSLRETCKRMNPVRFTFLTNTSQRKR